MPALVVNRTVQVSAIYGFFFYIYIQNICCGGRGKYSYSVYSEGGFNVSNLMGITRRMIDIGKKITFYF
jgi:hypothetical protein